MIASKPLTSSMTASRMSFSIVGVCERLSREGAGAKDIAVESCNRVTALKQHRRQHRANVTTMAGEQNFHHQLQVFQGAGPLSQSCCRICFSRSVSMHCQNES